MVGDQAGIRGELLEQLKDARSPKRRAATVKLRKLGDPSVGAALLEALEAEMPKVVTWETQYQMIRALGEIGYGPALPRLRELANESLEATTLYTAFGDAIFRLSQKHPNDSEPLLELLQGSYPDNLKWGALKAVAMLQCKFSAEVAASILGMLPTVDQINEPELFFPVVACAGWSGPAVNAFLDQCEASKSEEVREAARNARRGKYTKFNPL